MSDFTYEKKVGTSIAFCVRDIVYGNTSIDDVDVIIAGTKFETVDEIIDVYKDTYWIKFKEKAEEVCRKLWDRGKIIQPCLENPQALLFIRDIWYKNLDDLIKAQYLVKHDILTEYLEELKNK